MSMLSRALMTPGKCAGLTASIPAGIREAKQRATCFLFDGTNECVKAMWEARGENDDFL